MSDETKIEPLSDDEIARIRETHEPDEAFRDEQCHGCEWRWPCDAALLLADRARLKTQSQATEAELLTLKAEWQRKLGNRSREVKVLQSRLSALKNGAPVDPEIVANLNGLHERLVGQRQEIKTLRDARDAALADRARLEARVGRLEGVLRLIADTHILPANEQELVDEALAPAVQPAAADGPQDASS